MHLFSTEKKEILEKNEFSPKNFKSAISSKFVVEFV